MHVPRRIRSWSFVAVACAFFAFACAGCGPGFGSRARGASGGPTAPNVGASATSASSDAPVSPLDALVRWLPNGSDAVLLLSKKGAQAPLEALLDPVAPLLPPELTGLFLDARSLRDVLSTAAGTPNGPVLIRREGAGMEGSTVFARIDGGTEALSARAKPNALGLHVSPTGSDDVSLVVLSPYEVALAKQRGVDALSNAVASSNRGHPVALGGQSLVEAPSLLAEAWILTRHAESDDRGIVSVHARVDEIGRGVGVSLRIRSLAGQTEKLRELFKRTASAAKGPLAPSYKKARTKIDGGELVVDVSIGRDVLKKFGGLGGR